MRVVPPDKKDFGYSFPGGALVIFPLGTHFIWRFSGCSILLDGLLFIGIGSTSHYGRVTFHNFMNPPLI
jgi:hypothetical protein